MRRVARAAILGEGLSPVKLVILVESTVRIATFATRTAAAIPATTCTAAVMLLAFRSAERVDETTRLVLGTANIELLVLVGWYAACFRGYHLGIADVAPREGRIRSMMHGSMRRQRAVLDRDTTRLLLLLLLLVLLLVEQRGCLLLLLLMLLVLLQVVIQLILFGFSQLILLVVESLKNYGTRISLQMLVLLLVVQVDHLPVKHERRRGIAETSGSVSVHHGSSKATAAAILTGQRRLVRLLFRLAVRKR